MWGPNPLLPNSERFSLRSGAKGAKLLPFPQPWHAHRDTGLGGPARPNRLPAHTREKSKSPSCLSGVALRLRAPAGASLDAATCAGERREAGAAEPGQRLVGSC